ncbi:MAG TPA: glycosyltransferase family 39 protein, partial [Chloroflexota bacterium]|nr:glycosyltransferase family 39 protein [Chloroflexota bacterium]
MKNLPPSPTDEDDSSPDIRLVLALVVAFLACVATLLRLPAPDVDEMYFASRAVGLLRTGVPFGPLDSGVAQPFAGYWTYFPFIGTFFQSMAIRAFGLNLVAIRLPSLIFGLVLLYATYSIGRRLYSPSAGVVAALLVATSASFYYSAHVGRQDIFVAALGYLAISL